jgi:hypothetical protein
MIGLCALQQANYLLLRHALIERFMTAPELLSSEELKDD